MTESDKPPLPPPAAVFSGLQKKRAIVVDAVESKPNAPRDSNTKALVETLKLRLRTRKDYVPYYSASDDWMGSPTGQGQRPDIWDLAAIGQCRIGCAWMGSAEVASDAVRNWHEFVDPDKPDKPIHDKDTKAIKKFAIKTDLKNQWQQHIRWERVFGTSFMVKYFKNKEDRTEPPPNKPPRKFRAFSPRYMTPTNLNDSDELDYNEDVWEFNGGVFSEYGINKDRIDVLSTRPEEGSWLGLSIFEMCWVSLMGYFNNFIYIVKAFRNWGEQIPIYKMEQKPEEEDVADVLSLMDQFQAHKKWAISKEEDLVLVQTQIGKGIGESMEQFKEDISSCWRIPLNQMFGRSQGGGLQGAAALVSKEDYLQMVSNVEMSTTDDLLKIYSDAGFEVEQYDLSWNMAVKKTDEQKLREEGMETQNKSLKETLKSQKLQNKMLELQIEQMKWQQFANPDEEPPPEGEESPSEKEESQENIQPEISDFNKRFYNSIRIDNKINYPYK